MKPFCFVLMPFDRKTDENGRTIDFDLVYEKVIKPAVSDAGLEPIRAVEELVGGIIHKPMFERLMLCDLAVADLTSANPNVFYELGVRHGVRPHSTVLIFARGARLPFDVMPLRAMPYDLNPSGALTNADADRTSLTKRLIECRNPAVDSPLFQLVSDWPHPDIARLKTDVFRELVDYSTKYKQKLRDARTAGLTAVKAVERELTIADTAPAIVLDLFLSYRAMEVWQEMVDLADRMSPLLSRTVMVQEQLGLALNRLGRRTEAEAVLQRVIDEHGPSSETNGILGRVFKDLWQDALKSGRSAAAAGFLRKAISCYLAGFEADWRDSYPGINAVTLMELTDPPDERQLELLPVVRYSLKRRLASRKPDYWDFATLLELNVLSSDQRAAHNALADALAAIREPWEPKSTMGNLRLIRGNREKRGVETRWIRIIEEQLEQVSLKEA